MRPANRINVLSLAAYALVAAVCWSIHGATPGLNIDHIAYLVRTDRLLAEYPNGNYWQGYSARDGYAIILAYLHGWTGDHIVSLKIALAAMTVAWLAALQFLFRSLGFGPYLSRVAALLGGFHFAFGAPQWGVYSFSDSLHRTLVMPLLFVGLGWYVQNLQWARRLFVLPLCATACLVHLGSVYLLAILALLEVTTHVRRPQSFPRMAASHVVLAIGASGLLLLAIQMSGLALSPDAAGRLLPRTQDSAGILLNAQEAWEVELSALRWRNFPPTLPTLLVMLASAGPLLALGALGYASSRRSPAAPARELMLRLFLCVLLAAYSLQVTWFFLRLLLPVYPLHFEEIRAIVWLVPTCLYFWCDFLRQRFDSATLASAGLILATAIAVFPPLEWVRALPEQTRRQLLTHAVSGRHSRTPNDDIRLRQAQQWLGLTRGPRFYYDAKGAIAWLKQNVSPFDTLLTDRDEFVLAPSRAVGPATGFLSTNMRAPAALEWLALQRSVRRVLQVPHHPELGGVAAQVGATYVVLSYPHFGAVYQDEHYSIVPIDQLASP